MKRVGRELLRAGLVVAGLAGPCIAGAAEIELGSYVRGGDNDPRVRAADFQALTGAYLSASTLLRQTQLETQGQALPLDFNLRLADHALGFGMQKRAEAIYRQQVGPTKDPIKLAKARLALAEFLYDHGFYPEASEALVALREQLPQKMLVPWQDLYSRTLLAQGEYADAAEILTKLDNASSQNAYMRYNLAVAFMNDGRADAGISQLDRVSRETPFDSEALALRDKANLALAYKFLREKQGGSAIPVFNRIRTEGPYSNRALLGLGWAYLAPTGKRQKRVFTGEEDPLQSLQSFSTIGALLRPGFLDDDIYRRAGLRSFRLDRVDPSEEANLKRALVPWVELQNRDPMDPAVQEGLLAIPFALERLGAHIEAKDYYEKGIVALEQTRTNLDQAMSNIRAGTLVAEIVKHGSDTESGWTWQMKSLPNLPEMFYLQNLLAEHPYQSAIKDYRDVGLMLRENEAARARIHDVQGAYVARMNQPFTDAKLLQNILDQKRHFVWYKPLHAPVLRLDDGLSLPPSEALAETANPPVALKLTTATPKFDGAFETMSALLTRLDALDAKLKAAQVQGSNVLQDIALADLEAQKKLNEKYLVEARFALARIYDRQLHGDEK